MGSVLYFIYLSYWVPVQFFCALFACFLGVNCVKQVALELFGPPLTFFVAASRRLYTQELLKKYCCALEKSVQISCKYNIPPLPGRTLFIVNIIDCIDESWTNDEFCLPPEITDNLDENKLSAKVRYECLVDLCLEAVLLLFYMQFDMKLV